MKENREYEPIILPPGFDIEDVSKLTMEDIERLRQWSDAYKKRTKTEWPISNAILFGIALAVGIVLVQFGFYKAGLVGSDFLSVKMQVSVGPVPVGPADQVPNDGGNSGK